MNKEFPDIRTGVIGVGSMGQNHARVYSEISNLVAVADIDAAQSKKIGNRFGIRSYESYRDMLNEVDAVTISVPTDYHCEVVSKVAEAGVHILVEKPIAGNLKDSKKIIKSAKKADIKLAVGHIERHNPVIKYAKKALLEKIWGDLITMSSKRLSNYPERIHDVGVILDLATHELDVMRYLANSEIQEIKGVSGKKEHKVYEDHAAILLNFKNGIKGLCEVNWLTPQKIRKISLTCTKSFVEIDYINQSIVVNTSKYGDVVQNNLYKVSQEIISKTIKVPKYEPLKNELEDFLKSIISNKNPLVTGEDGLIALEMALKSM